ncbi:hypothetical protein FRC02_011413 [Tulasnella sp. 418]|nr:hypothetical protein FRC02_011413 [Tulasnella sp. 418]
MTSPSLPPRPTSIESALALERDLAMDNSSTDDHASVNKDAQYDSEVLSHLVIQLRMEVAQVTSERDDAIAALSEATLTKACLDAKAADYADELDILKAKMATLERERDDALKKARDEEEQVTVLREKVEEARRGVMRLQAENRRHMAANKPVPLDLSQASRAMNGPPSTLTSAKRSSFILGSGPSPRSNQGAGHRRISSMSDSAMNVIPTNGNGAADQELGYIPPSPASPTFENSVNGSGSTIKTKRLSLLNRRDEPAINPLAIELEATRAELMVTKQELMEAKKDLQEAADARVANEGCLKALKAFIEEHAIGQKSSTDDENTSLKGLRLPPLPSDTSGDDDDHVQQQPKKSGWAGLKLWRENSNTSISSSSPNASTLGSSPNPEGSSSSTPLASFVSTWTRSVSTSSQNSQPATSPGAQGFPSSETTKR